MIYGNTVGGSIPQTYILVDEAGNEITAALVSTETVFDAGPNDIRLGKTALTDMGAIVGEKEIPAYHTSEGFKVITNGKALKINLPQNRCEYTKLLAMVCTLNTNVSNSVSTYMVSIGDKIYEVNSTTELSVITVDLDNSAIDFGLSNDSGKTCIIRFMTYKEED